MCALSFTKYLRITFICIALILIKIFNFKNKQSKITKFIQEQKHYLFCSVSYIEAVKVQIIKKYKLYMHFGFTIYKTYSISVIFICGMISKGVI